MARGLVLSFTVFVVTGVAAFFLWANRTTRREHARFTREDVRSAIENALDDSACCYDEFEMFLHWPIDDQHLDSVRQRCIGIWEQHPACPDELRQKLLPILDELQASQKE